MECFCHTFGFLNLRLKSVAKIVLEDVAKELKLTKVVVASKYKQSLGPFKKLFGSLKQCSNVKSLLTGHYFKCCIL